MNDNRKIRRRKYKPRRTGKNVRLFLAAGLIGVALLFGIYGIHSAVTSAKKEAQEQATQAQLQEMAKDPETAAFAQDYPGDGTETAELTEEEKQEDFPLFLQWDKRWGYLSYGEDCIGLSGCGPTALSMACFALTRDASLTPDKVAAYAMEQGYYVEGSGTTWELMQNFPQTCGLDVSEVGASQGTMEAALDRGAVLVCAVGKGYFTSQGHFIVIYGCNEDGFFVNDPNSTERSRMQWKFDDIQSQLLNIWALERP